MWSLAARTLKVKNLNVRWRAGLVCVNVWIVNDAFDKVALIVQHPCVLSVSS